MKQVVLLSLVLMGCPEDGPAGGSQASPHANTTSQMEMAPNPTIMILAVAHFSSMKDVVKRSFVCEEPAQNPPTPEAVTP